MNATFKCRKAISREKDVFEYKLNEGNSLVTLVAPSPSPHPNPPTPLTLPAPPLPHLIAPSPPSSTLTLKVAEFQKLVLNTVTYWSKNTYLMKTVHIYKSDVKYLSTKGT